MKKLSVILSLAFLGLLGCETSGPLALKSPLYQEPRIVHHNFFQFPTGADGFTYENTSGWVVVWVDVGSDGRVIDHFISQSTAKVFADVVENNISRTPFRPATQNGYPVRGQTEVRVWFERVGDYREVQRTDTFRDHTRFVPRWHVGGFDLIRPERLDKPLTIKSIPEREPLRDREGNLVSGTVTVRYFVDRDGRTRMAEAFSEGDPNLIRYALDTINDIEYEIPKYRGFPAPVVVVRDFQVGEAIEGRL